MDETSAAEAGIAIVGTIGVFLTIIVVAWQFFATARARMSVAREEGYRQLAEQSTAAIERMAAQLDRQAVQIADIHTRTAELERLLKEVG